MPVGRRGGSGTTPGRSRRITWVKEYTTSSGVKEYSSGSSSRVIQYTALVLVLLVQLTCTLATTSNKHKVHELMSKEELASVFQVAEHHEVPEYEIVHIHHRRQKRSTDDHTHQVSLTAFGRDLELDMSPNRDLLPQNRPLNLYMAETDGEEISYVDEQVDVGSLGLVYQDSVNQAALLLYKDSNDKQYLMDGTIGDDLVVKPAPSSVEKFMQQRSRSSEPPSHWPADQDYHWPEPYIHSEINITKPNYLEEEEEELPVDYAFLDEDDDGSAYNGLEYGGQGLAYKGRYRREIKQGHRRSKRYKRDGHCDTCVQTGIHIVYKRRDNAEHLGDYEVMEKEETTEDKQKKTHSRSKRQAPFMIFPEILVIVDYDGYRLHGEDNIAIKRYVISFWNGVDLRYKLLKAPSVKISIAGIIISRGRDATPYLERNRVGRDAIDAASALTDMGKYLFLERRLPVYDIAVAITKLDMCRRKTRHGDCNRGTAGFAYVGGACVVNKRLEKVNSVAIVEDTGGFSGIIVAAHELGHLLGAVHDGSPPPSYLGGPGAVKCSWEDGYIMSDLRHTSKGFKWSYCTVNQFHHFLNGETATCMYNSPHEEESLPRVLPGKLLSLDAQCRKDRGTSACFKDDRVCAQLFCFDAGSGYCVSYRPAAEGSRCGDHQMCLNGKCVSEHENAIDYGDGFLRRTGTAISTTVQRPDSQTKRFKPRRSRARRY